MSLNLTGNYFGSSEIGRPGGQQPGLFNANDAKAVLYLFRGHAGQFRDVTSRPFQYHFDRPFLSQVEEVTDLAKRGSAMPSAVINDMMSKIRFSDRMIPSYQPMGTLRLSHLSDNWRFILILTESPQDLFGGGSIAVTTSSSKVRRIYTGYFMDEPLNPLTLTSTRRTLNPNSFMVITHKTVVGSSVSHGRFGPQTEINTQASEEIVRADITQALSGSGTGRLDKVYLMTPENCMNSVDISDDGYSVAVPGAHSDITNDRGANVVQDVLEQPTHNVKTIMNGMIRFTDEITNRNRLSSHRSERYFDDDFLDNGFARAKMGRYMALPRSDKISKFDLNIDDRISPVDLDTMVNGALEVVDMTKEHHSQFETADQTETSICNQYSSLIAAVVPPIMNSAGLNSLQFEYQIAKIRGEVQREFRPVGGEANYPVPQADLLQMIKAVEYELVYSIFDTIYDAVGDYHVQVSANATGMTHVRLNMVGQGHRNFVDFEIPSCMGGIISPLIGNSIQNASNSEAIETLFNTASGMDITKTYTDDDRNFIDRANQMPWPENTSGDSGYTMDWSEDMEID